MTSISPPIGPGCSPATWSTSADVVLTMARHHRARVEQLGAATHAHLLGEFAGRQGTNAEVRDPFGGDLEGYRETFEELDGMLDTVVQRLDRGAAR